MKITISKENTDRFREELKNVEGLNESQKEQIALLGFKFCAEVIRDISENYKGQISLPNYNDVELKIIEDVLNVLDRVDMQYILEVLEESQNKLYSHIIQLKKIKRVASSNNAKHVSYSAEGKTENIDGL